MTQQTMEKVPYKQIDTEGTFNGVIKDAKIIQHRFKPEAGYEVKLEVVTNDNGTASIYLDMREDYVSAGAMKGRKQVEASLVTLEKLGLLNNDLSKVKELRAKPIQIFGKKNDKGHLNFYISNFEEKEVDPAIAAKEIAMLIGGSTITAAAGGAPKNPFLQQ